MCVCVDLGEKRMGAWRETRYEGWMSGRGGIFIIQLLFSPIF